MAEGSRGTMHGKPSEQATKIGEREGMAAIPPIAETQRRMADAISEHSGRTFETVSRAGEIYREASGATTEDMTALLSSCSVVAKGLQDIQRVWLEAVQKSLQSSVKAPQSMLRWSNFSDIAQSHRDLLRESMQALLEGNARMLRIAGKIAEDAAHEIEDRTRRPS
jgi:hypothetical protein